MTLSNLTKQQLIKLPIGTVLIYTNRVIHLIEVKLSDYQTLIVYDKDLGEYAESVGGTTDIRKLSDEDAKSYIIAPKEISRCFE